MLTALAAEHRLSSPPAAAAFGLLLRSARRNGALHADRRVTPEPPQLTIPCEIAACNARNSRLSREVSQRYICSAEFFPQPHKRSSRRGWAARVVLSALRAQPRGAGALARHGRRDAADLPEPAQSVLRHAVRPLGRRRGGALRAHHAPLRQAGIRPDARPRSTARRSRSTRRSCGRSRSARSCISAATCRRTAPADPKLLIVAPLSGHYATLLRGTVEAMLPEHEVFITDWADARMVPVSDGQLRPRRLHRLPDRDLPPPRAGDARDGGLPAVRAGARRVALLSEDGDPLTCRAR